MVKALFLLISMCIGLVGCVSAAQKTNGVAVAWEVASATRGALVSRDVLDLLYAGNTGKAIDLLEANMDNEVCHLDGLMRRQTERRHKALIQCTLEAVARFRQNHKRPPVSPLVSGEGRELLSEQAMRTEQILNRYSKTDEGAGAASTNDRPAR